MIAFLFAQLSQLGTEEAAYLGQLCVGTPWHPGWTALGRVALNLVENRSITMLPVGTPALDREEPLELLVQLVEALRELREMRRQQS